jgi:cytochrome P450
VSTRTSLPYDPFDQAVVDDPYPVWRELGPISWSDALDAWVVTGYADVQTILRDPATFPSGGLGVMRQPPPEVAKVLAQIPHVPPLRASDPPDHARKRRPTLAAVAPRRIAGLEPRIREIAAGLAASGFAEGTCDFYREFAYPFPLAVISELLGFDPAIAPNLHHWASCRVALAWGDMQPAEWLAAAHGFVEFNRFIEAEILDRRAHPRDDGLTDFVAADEDSPNSQTLPELVENTLGLITGGHETTANWLTLAMYHLLSERSGWETLCADPSTAPQVVEETLRYDSSVRAVWRRAARDVTISGRGVRAGQRLYCAVAAANRDDAEFPRADDYQPERPNSRAHLSFGRGPHVCIGASLSRVEGRIALEVLAGAVPSVQLLDAGLSCVPNATLRIVRSLRLST